MASGIPSQIYYGNTWSTMPITLVREESTYLTAYNPVKDDQFSPCNVDRLVYLPLATYHKDYRRLEGMYST